MRATVRLSVLRGPHQGATFMFPLPLAVDDAAHTATCDALVVIGRAPPPTLSGSVHIVALPLDKELSAVHAQLEFKCAVEEGGGEGDARLSVTAAVLDLASTNGTRVPAVSLEPVPCVPLERKGIPRITLPSDNLTPCPLAVGGAVLLGKTLLCLDGMRVESASAPLPSPPPVEVEVDDDETPQKGDVPPCFVCGQSLRPLEAQVCV